ncbi:MAG: DUF2914 domain-containing protein [Pseudomonadota bacterium]
MKKLVFLLCLFFGGASVCMASDVTIEEWRLCYQIDGAECSFPVTDGLVVNDEIKKIYFWVKVKSPRDGFIRHVYSFYGNETKPHFSHWSDEERELHMTKKVPSMIEKIGLDEFVNAVIKLKIRKSGGFRTWSTKNIGEPLHCGKWAVDVVDENGEKLIPTVEFAVVSKR